MSHPSLRSTLVPLASGLAAVIVVAGLCGATPALGAVSAAGAGGAAGAGADSVRAQEWWLTSLHVTKAWPATQGSGVTVAVLGTGVAARHQDLAGSVITGPDDTGSGRTPGDALWGVNGTEVAGVIAGHGHGAGDRSGIIGVAPAAKIMSIRVNLEFNDPLNSGAAFTRRLPGAIASGITYAVNHGARIIDLPLDPGTFGLTGHGDPAAAGGSTAERDAVAYALRKSVILIAPAGDDGQGPGIVNYPAAYPGVIAVGTVGRNGHLAAFSSRRTYVTLTAPGVNMAAAAPPDGYETISSTSAASGIVAGVAALIVSRFPQLSSAQVTEALTESTSAATAGSTPAARSAGAAGNTAGTGNTSPGGAGGVAAGSAAAPGTGYGTVDAARAVELAAVISSAGQARQPATPTAKPQSRAVASPHRANASTLAGSLVRDVVAALGVLILLLVVLLVIMNSRRRRAAAAVRARPGQPRGMHEHRRPDRSAGPGPQSARPGGIWAPGAPPAGGTAQPGVAPAPAGVAPLAGTAPPFAIRPQPAQPSAGGWPAPGGWQGGSIGEIAHSAPPSPGPAMTPAPKAGPSRGSRGVSGHRGSDTPAGPPWDPASEPERTIGPLPMASASWFSPERGPGIRVPGDMAAPSAPAADPSPSGFDSWAPPPFQAPPFQASPFPAPAPPPAQDFPDTPPGFRFTPAPSGFDVTAPQRALDFTTPQRALDFTTPAAKDMAGPPTVPGFPALGSIPDFARPAAGSAPADAAATPDSGAATASDAAATAPESLTQRNLGFAAAPVATDYPAAADSASVWDLAATDAFPVAPPEPGNDDAPGASES